ncbi:serine hydrolase domain-containing protein [Promicromonospora thailandica]|uniref:CubicO group peptidase, beta-lactamase class C family n=1 Tax=Promicromonospora thailandica TaxID=765201 RepID=A0A9X2JWP8_9MICO|nr:serine hydrolase domain-containing protein [Promicromonospora thailandica]MCP2266371.1 CubicO group peptidase, beta-lactamase class C family [Promicromonospora thailandica]
MSRILPRSTPRAEGVDPAAVRRLVDRLDGLEDVHSLLVVRHGNVIAEGWWHPHTADRPHTMFSVSKSFTSTAVGLAVDEGLLSLDDRVVDLLPDDVPADPGEHLRAMRVRHLLTMTTGHSASTMEGIDRTISLPGARWARSILAQPVDHEPGTHFVYNTGATYLLSAILHRLTGERLLDYLTPRLLAPLGITHAEWEQDPDGIDTGGFGLSITTEEMAAFGQLYLQGGRWAGEQLVPAQWVAAATAAQVPNGPHDWPEWNQGYGYQFWQCRYGAYRADGAFGQYIVVWPEKDLVITMTSGLTDLQSVLDAVWETLLPDDAWTAEEPGVEPEPGPFELALRPPAGAAESPVESTVAGVTFDLAANERDVSALALGRADDGRLELTVTIGGLDHFVRFGHDAWSSGTCTLQGAPADVATSAAWADESTLRGRMIFVGTPFEWHLELRFAGDGVTVTIDRNVSFGKRGLLHATGTARRG